MQTYGAPGFAHIARNGGVPNVNFMLLLVSFSSSITYLDLTFEKISASLSNMCFVISILLSFDSIRSLFPVITENRGRFSPNTESRYTRKLKYHQ